MAAHIYHGDDDIRKCDFAGTNSLLVWGMVRVFFFVAFGGGGGL